MKPRAAKLVFKSEGLIALPKVAETLAEGYFGTKLEALDKTNVSLTTMRLASNDKALELELKFPEGDTQLSLSNAEARQNDALLAQLAAAAFILAKHYDVDSIIWPGAPMHIPARHFVIGLTEAMEGYLTLPTPARVATVMPRRVAPRKPASRLVFGSGLAAHPNAI